MALTAERRWDILRVLYEEWEAPMILLAELSGKELSTFNERIQDQNWQIKNSTIGLHRQLSEIVKNKIQEIGTPKCVDLDLEKSSRAIGVLAKTMESVANVALKLNDMEQRTVSNMKSEIDDAKHSMQADNTFELDQKLEALVTGFETEGNSAASHKNVAR